MAEQQQPKIGDDVTALMSPAVSHAPEAKRPEQILAESDPNYLGNDPGLGKRVIANLPNVAAMAATMAVPELGVWTIPARMAAAGAGGAMAAGARGDDATNALMEGGKQAAIEGIGGGIVKLGGTVARGLMKGTVPKNIAKDFTDVDIPQEMLNRGVVPGSNRSLGRVQKMSTVANAEREAAAQTVPTMPRSKVIEGLRPMHAKGVKGKVPEMSEATLEQMRKSAREIGPSGLNGPEALARKDIKQAQGNAALNASDQRTAAFGSQLADAERKAIVSHLRDTPRMNKALDESQTLMAIEQVMQDAKHSNPVTRMRIGGLTAGTLSPIGLGITAHAVNQGSRMVSPQMIRALQLAVLRGGEQ